MRTVYEVTYQDDFHYTHIAFLSSWHDILFLIDRFGKENVTVKKTKNYPHIEY